MSFYACHSLTCVTRQLPSLLDFRLITSCVIIWHVYLKSLLLTLSLSHKTQTHLSRHICVLVNYVVHSILSSCYRQHLTIPWQTFNYIYKDLFLVSIIPNNSIASLMNCSSRMNKWNKGRLNIVGYRWCNDVAGIIILHHTTKSCHK